jgi:hypothetical protein
MRAAKQLYRSREKGRRRSGTSRASPIFVDENLSFPMETLLDLCELFLCIVVENRVGLLCLIQVFMQFLQEFMVQLLHPCMFLAHWYSVEAAYRLTLAEGALQWRCKLSRVSANLALLRVVESGQTHFSWKQTGQRPPASLPNSSWLIVPEEVKPSLPQTSSTYWRRAPGFLIASWMNFFAVAVT